MKFRSLTLGIGSLFLCLQGFAAEKPHAVPTPAPTQPVEVEADPFTGVEEKPISPSGARPSNKSWTEKFFSENFGFRKEIMSQFGTTGPGNSASRQSIGFEVLKKFSTDTKTWLGIDFQGRMVQRNGFVESPNALMGQSSQGLTLEYHNAYADFYDLAGSVGSVNGRIGHFYVPFGLNLQTDTHGTVLQLSNERNFGFERDWYAGFYGILTDDLRYDLYYLAGSGYPIKFAGQNGMEALRISLANKYQSEDGLEGGLSLMGGQRLDHEATMRSPAVAAEAGPNEIVGTLRAGLDGRYRKGALSGLFTWTSEVSGGRDKPDPVVSQLHQLDYLYNSRCWGLAAQYLWFWQDMTRDKQIAPASAPSPIFSALLGQFTWYFANDVSASNLHWITLNSEYQFARQTGDKNVVWTLQYYRYW